MKSTHSFALMAIPMAAMLAACSQKAPPAEPPRPVRTVELRYDAARETNRYAGVVRARHEVDEAFRVGGKVAQRKVDVGQVVREGDVLAVLDATDYRLAEEAARQQLLAAETHARQAESDRKRLEALKTDGSVSASDDEHAASEANKANAAAAAAARQLQLAANRLKYTVLRASRSGVVTQVRFEIGQVVAEGQPGVAVADDAEPEIVVDVPEDHVAGFKKATFKATLPSQPNETFDVTLREISPQAALQTRTYRARLQPSARRDLPLGATATLLVQRDSASAEVATIPSTAITQKDGHPALWVVHRTGANAVGTVELVSVEVEAYRNEEVLVSGRPAGELVVAAGVHKMAPGLQVALSDLAAQAALTKQASR
ncbi:MAG: efflux RND transporter periplasmic adaptor subunit [Betaproteobacteria bacterium]|nr:efflux RND transporter periplasmic adaptor subunit [Betaproteobacteria bacterium]